MKRYDRLYSWGYDMASRFTGLRRIPRRLSTLFRQTAGPLAADGKVLDFGCGTGLLTQALLKDFGAGLDVTGLDPSSAMREKFGEKFTGRGNVALKAGGYENGEIAEASASYDAVVSSGVLDHIRITPGLMGEFLRIVKPGGWVALTYERHDGPEPCRLFEHGGSSFYRHTDDFVRGALEKAGGDVVAQDRMTGYVLPRLSRAGLIVARRPS